MAAQQEQAENLALLVDKLGLEEAEKVSECFILLRQLSKYLKVSYN